MLNNLVQIKKLVKNEMRSARQALFDLSARPFIGRCTLFLRLTSKEICGNIIR